MIERMPFIAGTVTLAVGAALLARAAFNLGDAAYLYRVAPRSSLPVTLTAGAALMAALTVVDGTTALALRRRGA